MQRLIAILLMVFLLPGCLYSHVKAPLDLNLDKTQLGSKEGRATSKSFVWLVAVGDSGTHAAAKDGGIKTINHADIEVFQILFGVYSTQTTIVYGD